MFDLPLIITPNKLVIFEGLDDTGKSTQLEKIEAACVRPQMGEPLYSPEPFFTHQPSGASGIGPDIYDLTESVDWSQADPFTRQLLHLAAHVEHYHHDILPALQKTTVMMDRCWWSTYAYGYRDWIADRMTPSEFRALVQLPTRKRSPDIVFLFTHQYGEKSSKAKTSSDRTTFRNYLDLQERYKKITHIVPDEDPGKVNAFITGKLYEAGIVKTKENNL